MMSAGNFQLSMVLYYTIYGLLAIVCLGAIVRALWAPLEILRAPSCGGCGHGVRDILQGLCPECGAQYAKVGISTPSMAIRLRGSLPIALLAWTTLTATAASFTHGWLERQAWQNYATAAATMSVATGPQQEMYSTELTPSTFGSGGWSGGGRASQSAEKEDLDYRISLALNYVIDGDKVQSGTCVMKLRRNGEPESWPLSIDLSDGTYTIKDSADKVIASGGKDAKVDAAAIEKWFKSAELDTSGAAVKRGMKDVEKLARYAKADPGAIDNALGNSFSNDERGALRTGSSSSSSGGAPGGFATAMMAGPPGVSNAALATSGAVLGTLYIAGCIAIVWRNRRVVKR